MGGKKKWVIAAVSLVLVGLLGTAGTVGYLTFVRSPIDPPSEACADGDTAGARTIVTAGASLTRGTLGADWVGALRDRPEYREHRFVNAGVNGNTTADLLERVDTDVVACRPDVVTLLIGTNDVRNDVPPNQYRDNLAAIVDRVKTGTSARIALLSIPPVGEDPDGELNRRLGDYNAAVEEIAVRAGVDYLPLHERMTDFLRQRGGEPTPFGFSFALAFGAASEHHLFGRTWDEVARGNDLDLFVDHIHLSDRGGAIVADLVAEWISTPDDPARP